MCVVTKGLKDRGLWGPGLPFSLTPAICHIIEHRQRPDPTRAHAGWGEGCAQDWTHEEGALTGRVL